MFFSGAIVVFKVFLLQLFLHLTSIVELLRVMNMVALSGPLHPEDLMMMEFKQFVLIRL